MDRILLTAAALSAALAVIAGAFGAHGLAGQGDTRGAELFKTASQYQFGHAVAILALLARSNQPITSACLLLAGSLVFAGSLYALGLGAPTLIGIITPIGGLVLILGWLLAAWRFWSSA